MARAVAANLHSFDGAAAAGAATIAELRVELAVFEDLNGIEQIWRAFERDADCTVFQTYDWLSTWQRHIGARDGVKPAIVVGREGGQTLFILPFAIRPVKMARELAFLGTELCDYNTPLLAPRFANSAAAQDFVALWRQIMATLQRQIGFDLIHLEKMPAKVGGQANPMLALPVTLNPSHAYATALSGDWETFYAAKRSSATRSRDRGKRKKLAEAGALEFVQPRDTGGIVATIDTLVAQKSRAFVRMGVSNIFARPGHLDFYRALFTDPATRALTHVSRLDCAGQATAINLGLTFRDTYYHLQASHDDGELSRFGPGAAHLHDLLRTAIDNGFKVYDFTIGDESYKRDWCDGQISLYDHLALASARGAPAYAMLAAKLWLKRRIKQNPVLWEKFKRARSALGALRRQ